jgi:hypothetical protein
VGGPIRNKSRRVVRTFSCQTAGLSGNATYTSEYTANTQRMTTTNNAPEHLRLGGDRDIGGAFFSQKLTWGAMPGPIHLQGDLSNNPGPNNGWQSIGVLVPGILSSEMGITAYSADGDAFQAIMPAAESESSLEAKGTTAISRVIPTSPVWDGATAIAELYGSGIPLKPPGLSGNVGGEYLNIHFGIVPTVSDIAAMRKTAQQSEKILAQLERDSGKSVRRKYEFPPEDLSPRGPFTGSGDFPTMLGGRTPTAHEVGRGTWRLDYKRTRTRRFSGAFTYHLPPTGTWMRKISELDALYGVAPGLETAWNAIPFSWLADYYANTGDVLKNITAFGQDGLVLRYGYITSVTEDVGTWTFEYPVRRFGGGNEWSIYSGTCQHSAKSVMRLPANPFGFGLSGLGTSPRQMAILAALGISLKR